MRKLPTTLYSANREMKAILRNSPHGISWSHMPSVAERIRVLEPAAFDLLMQYTINAGGVIHYRKGGEDYLISLLHTADKAHVETLGMEEIIVDPRKPVTPPLETPVSGSKATPDKKQPIVHLNREKPVRVSACAYKDDLVGIPEGYHVEAIEIMDIVSGRQSGLTISELTRVAPKFDYLEPEQRKLLIEAIDQNSTNYVYIDAAGLLHRAPGTMVLLNRKFVKRDQLDWDGPSEVLTNTAMADQLSALKGKLDFTPKVQARTPVQPVSQSSAKPTRIVAQPVVPKVVATEEALPPPVPKTTPAIAAFNGATEHREPQSLEHALDRLSKVSIRREQLLAELELVEDEYEFAVSAVIRHHTKGN